VNTAGYQMRRANSDDLPALVALWRRVDLSPEALETAFTEFQLVLDDEGTIVAAIGLRIDSGNGLLHSECLPDFSLADPLRPLLWERVLQVARNHGLNRIWTQETAPFWKHLEFVAPDGEQLAKMPESFRQREGAWLVMPLKNEDDLKRLDREFEQFLQEGRQQAEELRSRGRMLYGLAILLALALFVFVLSLAVRVLRKNRADLPAPRPVATLVAAGPRR
jgi:N-acetylglutamate synthase-like GNAT family acetyltransferase